MEVFAGLAGRHEKAVMGNARAIKRGLQHRQMGFRQIGISYNGQLGARQNRSNIICGTGQHTAANMYLIGAFTKFNRYFMLVAHKLALEKWGHFV